MPFKDEDYLKLCVEQSTGVVWMADGLRTPTSTGASVSQFLKCLPGRRLAIRILGMAQNVRLLRGLCEMVERKEIDRLQIAGPTICETAAERDDPERALYRMRQCLLSASLGGWHNAIYTDTATYRLAARLEQGEPAEDSDELMRKHPLWADLSFPGRVDLRACSQVTAYLLDPRWYIDPMHPDRTSRATSFMGVLGSVQRRIERGYDLEHPRCARYLAVLRSWKCDPPPSPSDMERPEYFLWRRYNERGVGLRGELRASTVFLDYLLKTWLQRIADLAPRPIKLFSPSAFLRPGEAAAYRQHVAAAG
jgi:hypothetical protein